ncbi:4-hydroxybenzoate 3-monooxygenase [Paucibacter sp. APW11]|uniref:4-hydroxybenzoate 3-monooxygenase n=1 Tax=Roseateles aquae TaxID=3077235 RepID=A0ABU3PAL0_9BURK|nr:4-hydroxybenzoate 3-monooxygenase [Paucibacter sp. APW11]MDT8999619.1 4-hydroxybenzoate 3-monooxygenase [Paucibacter sp. APW11]
MQRTQIAIVGAGPTGLLLGALLHRAGISNVIVERCRAEDILARSQACVLEDDSIAVLNAAGLSLGAQALRQDSLLLSVDGRSHRVELARLTAGRGLTQCSQTELTRSLMRARAAAGMHTIYEAQQVSLHGFLGADAPLLRYRKQDQDHEIRCDYIAGCDGFHGVSRASVPPDAYRCYERLYPFGWLGVLAECPAAAPELLLAQHPRGFALSVMAGPQRSHSYIQCSLSDRLTQWSDTQFWAELRRRLGPDLGSTLPVAPALDMSITPLRSFVLEPVRFGRLLLAGDAAHVVPPTGAKGLNLAATDTQELSEALAQACRGDHAEQGLNNYSERALRRTWRAERFSWALTRLLHSFPDQNSFDQRIQQAELEHLLDSRAAQTVLAESFVGQPASAGGAPGVFT